MSTVPPLLAQPGVVRDGARALLVGAAVLEDTAAWASRAATSTGWEGRAALAHAEAARDAADRSRTASLALRAVARGLQGHADALAVLLERRAVLERRTAARLPGPVGAPAGPTDDLGAEIAAWSADVAAETGRVVAVLAAHDTASEVARAWRGTEDPAEAALAALPEGLRGRSAAGPGAGASSGAEWWRGLSGVEREAVIVVDPALVGGLDGLPATVRDEANTIALGRDLATLPRHAAAGALDRDGRRRWDTARAAHRSLGEAGRGALLHDYDPDAFAGDGALAVALGELDRADDVVVLVPGLGTDARSGPHQVARARDLLDAAVAVEPDRSVAVLAWIGYDAPSRSEQAESTGAPGGALRVLSDGAARRGGAHLAATVEGLRTARTDGAALGPGEGGGPGHEDRAHLSVVAHSYGSTTASLAGHHHGLDADELVLLGSPGAGRAVDHAAQTGLDPAHVWVLAHSHDPVTLLGNHGSWHLEALQGLGLGDDPAEDDFGARRLRAESDGDPHTGYLEPGGEALGNVALVVTGHGDAAVAAAPRHDPWWGPVQDPELLRPRAQAPPG